MFADNYEDASRKKGVLVAPALHTEYRTGTGLLLPFHESIHPSYVWLLTAGLLLVVLLASSEAFPVSTSGILGVTGALRPFNAIA